MECAAFITTQSHECLQYQPSNYHWIPLRSQHVCNGHIVCTLRANTGFFRSVVTKKRRESAHARILEGILNGELRACVDSRVTTDLKNPVHYNYTIQLVMEPHCSINTTSITTSTLGCQACSNNGGLSFMHLCGQVPPTGMALFEDMADHAITGSCHVHGRWCSHSRRVFPLSKWQGTHVVSPTSLSSSPSLPPLPSLPYPSLPPLPSPPPSIPSPFPPSSYQLVNYWP